MGVTPNICLVAILKDEDRFLDEWLVYNKMIGIDHFFIYDNDPAQPLKNFLAPHANYTTIINYWELDNEVKPGQDAQLYAYTHAFNNYIKEFEWVVFLDADEFIVLKQHPTIKEFLLSFKDEVSISLNWHMFGHNGFFNDPGRLITSSLNRRMFMPYPDVKTITKTAAIADITSAHYCPLKYGVRVDANHQPYMDEIYENKTTVAHINHYQCRSFKTWMRRVERGYVNVDPKKNAGTPTTKTDIETEKYLERFVTLIARDKNEHIDDFMLQYRFDIHEQISKINRNKTPIIKNCLGNEQLKQIDDNVKTHTDFLVSKTQLINNIGLFGKAGIAVFLFHYSRYINNPQLHQFAFKLFDDITDIITEDSPVSISNGLAGFGIAAEHLVAESFIKVDTDDLLEDIDTLINYDISKNDLSEPVYYKNILEFSTYYLARLNNPFNDPHHHSAPKTRHLLEEIHKALPLNHTMVLNALDLLCEFYPHRENGLKALQQIDMIISSLKNTTNENYLNFNPLYAAEILLEFSKKTENKSYAVLANDILHHHEGAYWEYINTQEISGRIESGLRYLYLGKTLNLSSYIEKGLSCLNFSYTGIKNELNTSNLKNLLQKGLINMLVINDWDNRLYKILLLFITNDDTV